MSDRPRVIVVSGSGRGVGKTELIALLLRALPDTAGVKVQRADGGETTLIEQTEPAENPDKDTGRYLEAGAGRAYLLSGPAEELLEPACQLLEEQTARVVVFETNYLAKALEPDLIFYVEGEGPAKPGAQRCRMLADVVVPSRELTEEGSSRE